MTDPISRRRPPEALWAGATLVCLLLLLAAFVTALAVPEPPGGHGIPHPEHPTMLRGGPAPTALGSGFLGWAVGAAEILLFGALIGLGARRGAALRGDTRGAGLRGLGPWLAAGILLHLGAWTALIVAQARYVEDPSPDLYLAWPAPTAIMLYLVWGLPAVFAILYAVGFRRWILPEKDEAAFAEIVERRRTAEARGGALDEDDA